MHACYDCEGEGPLCHWGSCECDGGPREPSIPFLWQDMGFPAELCTQAVCACSTGAVGVDMERCVAWMLQPAKTGLGTPANLDVGEQLQQLRRWHHDLGVSDEHVEDVVRLHEGNVVTAVASGL